MLIDQSLFRIALLQTKLNASRAVLKERIQDRTQKEFEAINLQSELRIA
jgi:tRNA A37 N6-isopentenylltransferase MiaA